MGKKFAQNIIAESRKTLPISIAYGIGIWLLAGLVQNLWWIQFACFLASVLAMVHLNNINLLIRIYSRSVSVFFLLLSCSAVWLFPSINGAITQLASVLLLMILFSCYQDSESTGKTFYVFMIIGAISLLEPHFLLFVPIVWLLMMTTIYSIGFKTFMASLIGLIAPYWLYLGWLLYQHSDTPSMVLETFDRFGDIQLVADYHALTLSQISYFVLLLVLFLTGAIHFWMTSYLDKIRVRQIYVSMILLTLYTILMLALQPQMFDTLIYMMTIPVSTITAHFFSLTRSRITNIFFFVVMAVILLITGMNLWISLSIS